MSHCKGDYLGFREVLGYHLAFGLAMVHAAVDHVAQQKCLVIVAAISAVSPEVAGRVGDVDHAVATNSWLMSRLTVGSRRFVSICPMAGAVDGAARVGGGAVGAASREMQLNLGTGLD